MHICRGDKLNQMRMHNMICLRYWQLVSIRSIIVQTNCTLYTFDTIFINFYMCVIKYSVVYQQILLPFVFLFVSWWTLVLKYQFYYYYLYILFSEYKSEITLCEENNCYRASFLPILPLHIHILPTYNSATVNMVPITIWNY